MKPATSMQYMKTNMVKQTQGSLNTNKEGKIGVDNPFYSRTFGDKNYAKALIRLKPDRFCKHIMTAALDPAYGREMSLAKEEEVHSEIFMPENRKNMPHERSENRNLPSFVYQQKDGQKEQEPNPAIPSKNKQEKPYESYNSSYDKKGYGVKDNDAGEKKNSEYKIISIVKDLEKKAKMYFSKSYRIDNKAEDEVKDKKLYEGNGLAAKVSYAGKTAKGYSKKSGYDAKPETKEPASYNDISWIFYGLPESYSGKEESNVDNYAGLLGYLVLGKSDDISVSPLERTLQKKPELDSDLTIDSLINSKLREMSLNN